MPTRKASVTWDGGFKSGKGHFHGASGAIDAPYSVGTRFGSDPGTNPEELLAAAEASCFSMALAAGLEKAGHTPTRIETEAACTIEAQGEGYRITRMALRVRAAVPGIEAAQFERIAQATKEGCPVSRALLGNMEITVEAQLQGAT